MGYESQDLLSSSPSLALTHGCGDDLRRFAATRPSAIGRGQEQGTANDVKTTSKQGSSVQYSPAIQEAKLSNDWIKKIEDEEDKAFKKEPHQGCEKDAIDVFLFEGDEIESSSSANSEYGPNQQHHHGILSHLMEDVRAWNHERRVKRMERRAEELGLAMSSRDSYVLAEERRVRAERSRARFTLQSRPFVTALATVQEDVARKDGVRMAPREEKFICASLRRAHEQPNHHRSGRTTPSPIFVQFI